MEKLGISNLNSYFGTLGLGIQNSSEIALLKTLGISLNIID